MEKLELRLRRIRCAAVFLKTTHAKVRNTVLSDISEALRNRSDRILAANRRDLKRLPASTTTAFRDRLTLNELRLHQARESLRQVSDHPDPLEGEVDRRTLANGLVVRRVPSPLGVILMIFESRPNVALESFSLAFKSGNAIILRGGKESMGTTSALYSIITDVLSDHELPADCVWGITDPDRALVKQLLQQRRWIDVVVPRGGNQLIDFVVNYSAIPIIKNDRGLCHIYVHDDANLEMAVKIVANAKVSRPGVCNAAETVLVHEAIAKIFIPCLHRELTKAEVTWYACPKTLKILGKAIAANVLRASSASWNTEYLDLKLNCRVVRDVEEALEHIGQFGSHHSEAIVTGSEATARRFQQQVDAAAVYWNASTRFTDGFELGLGGELGISTQKLHVRGPVGLRELTSLRWIVDGNGQIRS